MVSLARLATSTGQAVKTSITKLSQPSKSSIPTKPLTDTAAWPNARQRCNSRVIDEENVGWSVPPGEPELLFDKINEIYGERTNLDEFGLRARKAAIAKYSLDVAIERYRSELV